MSLEELSAAEQSAMDAMRKGEALDLPDEPAEIEEKPAAAPAPAPAAEEKPEGTKPPEGHVPHGALHEERERRKQAEQQLAEFKARLEALEKAAQPAEPQKPARPDPILDPDAFGEWLEAQIAEAKKPAAALTEQQQQARVHQQRAEAATRHEQEFAAANPDYGDAVKQLHGQRVAELKAMGWSDRRTLDQAGNVVPSQIEQIIGSEANAIFDNAMRLGRNPAEVLYDMAKLRGWKSKPAVADAERITATAKAQENVATLATASGEAQEGGLTLKQLSEMSEEELADLKKRDPKKYARAMGA